jgi:nicotinamide riboside transporter PnuC
MDPWSFALAGLGILQIHLTGKKRRIGWIVGLFTSALWLIYGATTEQYGFIISALVFGWFHWKNWVAWRAEA